MSFSLPELVVGVAATDSLNPWLNQDKLDDQTLKREEELAEEAEKAAEPVPEKSWEDAFMVQYIYNYMCIYIYTHADMYSHTTQKPIYILSDM